MRALHVLVGLGLAVALAGPAAAADGNDLRGLRLGMTAQELPVTGFTDFICAGHPDQALKDWTDYKNCPAEAEGDFKGLHGVGFKYDDSLNERARLNSANGGTKVGGHPVVLTMLFNDAGVAEALQIFTDPHVPPYLRKKAFLLATQAKVQYGDDGWTCTTGQPSAGEAPISDMFIKQSCEKITPSRHLYMQTDLYRHPGDNLIKDMVNETRLTITLRH
jgi:hypothetical protein